MAVQEPQHAAKIESLHLLEERRQSSLSAGTSQPSSVSEDTHECRQMLPVEICETVTLPAEVWFTQS